MEPHGQTPTLLSLNPARLQSSCIFFIDRYHARPFCLMKAQLLKLFFSWYSCINKNVPTKFSVQCSRKKVVVHKSDIDKIVWLTFFIQSKTISWETGDEF